MPKRSDINLIPTELQEQRKLEEVRKSFNFAGLGFLVLVVLVSLVFLFYRLKLKNDQDNLERQITREQERIRDLSAIEQDANRLKAKSDIINKIFKSQNRFSTLMDRLSESTPQDVTITNFSTFGDNKVSLSGNSSSYVSLANFITTSLDQSFGGKVFNGADLTSVSLDELTGRAKFTLIFYIKSNVLNKSQPDRL